MKKRRSLNFQDQDETKDSWVVAYADLITLLFVFLALILSVSKLDRGRLEALAQRLTQEKTTNLSKIKQQIDTEINNSNLNDQVETVMTFDGLEVRFSETLLFDSGRAQIESRGLDIVKNLGGILKNSLEFYNLAIDGHTDDVPIKTARFRSNWELSAQRAVNVLKELENSGVERGKMIVRAYADTKPIHSEEKKKNRRVNLLVY